MLLLNQDIILIGSVFSYFCVIHVLFQKGFLNLITALVTKSVKLKHLSLYISTNFTIKDFVLLYTLRLGLVTQTPSPWDGTHYTSSHGEILIVIKLKIIPCSPFIFAQTDTGRHTVVETLESEPVKVFLGFGIPVPSPQDFWKSWLPWTLSLK